jgi:hypothetical protein
MKGLGMYSGQIYERYGDKSNPILECIVPILDDKAEDEQYVADKYALLHSSWCVNCTACSISKEHIQKAEEKV